MPARKWSDEDLDEMRRLRLCTFTNAEVAERFGVSINVITNLMRIYKLVSVEEATDLRRRRMTGSKMPKQTRKRLSATRKRQFREDPRFIELRNRLSEEFKSGRGAELARLNRRAARGFDIPAELQAEYDFLVYRKSLTSREAGEVLGLIAPAAVAA
ncbi:hypothetical protein [Aurantimonas coralicida]|uniref:hypothetical protein n=1 Tax=Aurantimonas coralicida TaxID=182270 RepID=UPI001E3D70F0|nr:hypothetical protein [Aurantimonas coralicida]MCD1645278.1 hypothetical protein [Aurantimonas coralicida]